MIKRVTLGTAVLVLLIGIVILFWQGQTAAHEFPRENPIESAEIIEHCRTATDWCKGYIIGMTDAMLDAGNMFERAGLLCLPEGIATEDLTSRVIKHFKGHAIQEDGTGVYLVMDSLHELFPCNAA